MTYYIYDNLEERWIYSGDWWDVIGFFYDKDYRWHQEQMIDNITHNDNDCHYINDFGTVYDRGQSEKKRYYVIDDYKRIINKAEIVDAVNGYRPELKKPRPYKRYYWNRGGRNRGWGCGRCARWNKNYSAQLLGYWDDFHNDSRFRRDIKRASLGWELEPRTHVERNWKHHSKKRKQWM
jgi:hypothetical protein